MRFKYFFKSIDMDSIMYKIQELFSRRNVYFFAFLIIVFVVFLNYSKPEADYSKLIFNPFWPTVLIIYELFIQNFEKDKARKNEDKINSAGSVVRTAQQASIGDDKINILLLEALNGNDLIQQGINEERVKEFDKAQKEAMLTEGEEEGDPNNF